MRNEASNQKDKILILKSPEPLDDGLRKYNKLYYILGGAGVILGVIMGGFDGAVILGLLLCLTALGIKHCIADWRMKNNLRKIRFQLPYHIENEVLLSYIILPLTQLNMRVEKKSDGCPCIIDKGIIYDVLVDNEEGIFNIWWRFSIAKAFFSMRTKIPYYRKAVVAMGIIGYTVQQEMIKNKKD
ncbi:hypothetical protein HNQ56_003805 [Anaerotaenia torta]|uniref:hypothetical protein n=1 Tax=Anaerotaenia torta TaxID=433293 RepID=UPI003D209848